MYCVDISRKRFQHIKREWLMKLTDDDDDGVLTQPSPAPKSTNINIVDSTDIIL